MFTSMQDKFKADEEQLSWGTRMLLVTDQWFNVALWNGSQDQTISGHIAVKMQEGRATWFDKLVCRGLRKLESEHCKKAINE